MKKHWVLTALVIASLLAGATDSRAFGPKDLKKKAKEAADKAKGKAEEKAPENPADSSPAESGAASEATGSKGGDGGKVANVSTKFDYVPGDKVILMDDFTRDELGEFPARWKLYKGNFDVVDFKGERWLRLNGTDGLIGMKDGALPEKWTLEFDIYQEKMTGAAFTVGGLPEGSDAWAWYSAYGNNLNDVEFNITGGTTSVAKAPGGMDGRHHVSMMADKTSLKIYFDRERLVNIPEIDYKGRPPAASMGFYMWRYTCDPMITNVRFAQGGKQKVDMMATPFVTHGIVFDSGSDKLKPESAPVLRQVAAYLKENPEVKVTITGHTDDVGDTAANQTLSEKRAAAVAASLTADFGIDAGRMGTAGKGESAPIAKNDSPEGRAENRRVEFAKS